MIQKSLFILSFLSNNDYCPKDLAADLFLRSQDLPAGQTLADKDYIGVEDP